MTRVEIQTQSRGFQGSFYPVKTVESCEGGEVAGGSKGIEALH